MAQSAQNNLRDLRALRGDPFDRAQGHPEEARRMTNCLTTKDAKHTKEEIQRAPSINKITNSKLEIRNKYAQTPKI